MGSYVPSTDRERALMLEKVGVSGVDALFADVPREVRSGKLHLPEGLSEMEVAAKVSAMAAKNTVFRSIFRGAGAYHHYIPSIVNSVTGKETFMTAYTPYQAEISQGVLQSIFEYQTMICELLGMDAANASVYDGASAAAEAVHMCVDRKRPVALVAASAKPQAIATISTYCEGSDTELVLIPERDGRLDEAALAAALGARAACLYLESPNFFGLIEDAQRIAGQVHAAGAKLILGVNPIACALYKTPGELGADVAVGEGQPLGMPLSFGGPYLGIMAATHAMTRKLPGRIAGETTDADGNRAFVLTLQAREQHIRREKASSNICTNQALCAMTAACYMAAMGAAGMREAARHCHAKAHYLMEQLGGIPGFERVHGGAFFHEFVTRCPIDADALAERLAAQGILAGLPVADGILWCATELNTKDQIDELILAVKGAVQ
ncbi:aminomethyl-transferring glycine dehydrogenase subunit GcvPA [Bacillota bacterium Meth-B3]|nr:aminomethyl-transferring glycine dehydrogenase subunit GcvPA [Christensenellaceae bacterium]MEA5064948.1 aminomethyl-transferring glycine dehydrogenase subunit GcvPA [Eubacteriales bacterium]